MAMWAINTLEKVITIIIHRLAGLSIIWEVEVSRHSRNETKNDITEMIRQVVIYVLYDVS